MKRAVLQYLKYAGAAFLAVLALLCLQAWLDMSVGNKMADAYMRGVKLGLHVERARYLPPSAEDEFLDELKDICDQSWADTASGLVARRRTCGTAPWSKRSDQ